MKCQKCQNAETIVRVSYTEAFQLWTFAGCALALFRGFRTATYTRFNAPRDTAESGWLNAA